MSNNATAFELGSNIMVESKYIAPIHALGQILPPTRYAPVNTLSKYFYFLT
jgi:hypothetical protein